MSFDKKCLVVYTVWSLDVWGHGPEEHENYDCNANEHGEYDCEGYTVNDRCRVGQIEVETNESQTYTFPANHIAHYPSDKAITQALIDAGFLKESVTEAMLEIDGETDSSLYVDAQKDGRPIFQLEFEQTKEIAA